MFRHNRLQMILISVSMLVGVMLLAVPLIAQEDDETPLPEGYTQRFDILASYGNPVRGEELFNTFQADAGFACATCHQSESEAQLIGPGLLNVAQRAETRVDGQGVGHYLYTSIINPDDFVVDGFPDALMPENWEEIYSISEVFDIIAYLITLEGEDTSVDTASTGVVELDIEIPSELPDTADPVRGEELFMTFQPDAGFACSTCHFTDREDQLIGPGQLNLASRAGDRVEGQNAVEYIFMSIVSPDTYVLEGFSDALMPENWAEIYTTDDIFDIIAYMLTLEG